jgi:hypothetical protein
MKNTQNEGGNASGCLDEKQVRKLAILAAMGLKLGRRIHDKLQSVEDSIEMIARQMARNTKVEE